ncbi:MAG: NUDIX domain-containing protein [Candidatus Pacebacteria bacterium]|nr:NUDIX domain-containing protein [Candidatus Paceibacterota bacterium]
MQSSKKEGYFNPGVTVDVAIFTIEDNTLKILLIKRANEPFKGTPALPGGFIHKGESSLETAERILADKAGVKNVYIEQLYTFDESERDPRGQIISIAYFALVPREKLGIHEGSRTENPEFVSVENLDKLAFDHKKIIAYALKRLGDKILYTNIAYSLLPQSFTFSQLQKTYEIILGAPIDKRNFRKKFIQLDMIEETNEKLTGKRQRPAKLYRFKKKMPEKLKRFF